MTKNFLLYFAYFLMAVPIGLGLVFVFTGFTVGAERAITAYVLAALGLIIITSSRAVI